jgi:hypothetical protein
VTRIRDLALDRRVGTVLVWTAKGGTVQWDRTWDVTFVPAAQMESGRYALVGGINAGMKSSG